MTTTTRFTIIAFTTALLLVPLAALHAADAPAPKQLEEHGDAVQPDQVISFQELPRNGAKWMDPRGRAPVGGVMATCELVLPEIEGGCYFSGTLLSAWPGNANQEMPWTVGKDLNALFRKGHLQNPAVPAPQRTGSFALFRLTDGTYFAILPTVGPQTISWLYIADSGKLLLRAGTLGTKGVNSAVPFFAWARSADVYTACREVWEQAIRHAAIPGCTALRGAKH
jgi:hypothetical protein